MTAIFSRLSNVIMDEQVIAPLLIIQRVANKSALTSNTITSGRNSTFKARSRGRSMGGSGTLSSGDSMSSVDDGRTSSCEFEVGIETTNDFHQDKV